MIYFGLLDDENCSSLKSIKTTNNNKGGQITREKDGKILTRTVYAKTSTDYGFVDIANELTEDTKIIKIQVITDKGEFVQTFSLDSEKGKKAKAALGKLRDDGKKFDEQGCRCVFGINNGNIIKKETVNSGCKDYNKVVNDILGAGSDWEQVQRQGRSIYD